MPSGYKFPIRDSSGAATSTVVDFEDMFVKKDRFFGTPLFTWGNGSYYSIPAYDNVNTSRSSPTQTINDISWKEVNIRSISTGVGIKIDGSLWAWGNDSSGYGFMGFSYFGGLTNPNRFGAAAGIATSDWSSASSGPNYIMAIKQNGTIYGWGYNIYGNLGINNNTTFSSPVQIGTATNWRFVTTGGSYSTFAIKTDNTLWAWGLNTNGVLGTNNTTMYSSPVQIGSGTNWQAVYSAGDASVAVKTDGTLWVWGTNTNGQLGLGDLVHRSSPAQVGSLTNWQSAAMGGSSCAAIKTDGTLWAWGDNSRGGLGTSSTINYSSPVQVGNLTDWKIISGSGAYFIAIKKNGTLWGWGKNDVGELGLGDTVHRSSPVQIGSLTSWRNVWANFATYAILNQE